MNYQVVYFSVYFTLLNCLSVGRLTASYDAKTRQQTTTTNASTDHNAGFPTIKLVGRFLSHNRN